MMWKVVLRNTTFKNRHIWKNTSRNMSENKMPAAEKVESTTTSEKGTPISSRDLARNMVHVSDWNKKLLVFAKKYKTTAEIPSTLPFDVLTKARDRVRVKVANIMMLMTVVGSLCMVFLGKRAAERGETVTKMNMDWHKEYNEKAKKEQEEAAKKQRA